MISFEFIILLFLIIFIGLAVDYVVKTLKKENKNLRKDVDRLKYQMLTYENGGIFKKCDETLKEFNEIMFGNPPLQNKVIIVRSIKEYDFTAYKKDINALNEYLNNGWSVVNHETNEFVHTYVIGKPLVWMKRGDNNGE
jgi:hypothetical protein